MSGDLQNELAVPSFMEEAPGRPPFDWQSQRTNGREEKPRFCRAASRFSLTHSMDSTLRIRRFETT
jgi:hypothetical protein